MLSLFPLALLSTAAVVQGGPVPQKQDDGPNLPTLHTRQDDEGDWDYNATTRIQYFSGCSGEQTDAIKEAWKDAMMIAGAIGDPDKIMVEDWQIFSYFGDYWKADSSNRDAYWRNIKDNMRRIQEPQVPSWWGDWWNNRYISAVCSKFDRKSKDGRGCGTPGVRAHVLRHDGPDGDNMLVDTVYFCDGFFDYESTSERIQKADDDPQTYPVDNARTLLSRGSILLHELLHTGYTPTNLGGFLSPAGRDVEVKGTGGNYGAARGPERAKWLARSYSSFGMGLTKDNVDCYVYFAISRFMYNRWGKEVDKPKWGWPKGIAITGEVTDESVPEDDGLTDEERSLTCASKPCESYQDCEGLCPPGVTSHAICGTEGVCICGNQHPVLAIIPNLNRTASNATN
ncbi:hypothetical protein Q7P37_003260 [Cladosporium fusiforme]